MEAAKKRNVKFRYVTEITKDNTCYIKQMLDFAEIRHLDGMKGNFEVSDEKEYVAVATLKKAQTIPQLIFSNIPEVVEQQQFVFDSFWERATPAEQIINEIEKGVVHPTTQVFSDYHEAEKKEHDMIRNAAKEIQIVYSTSNAFYLQERGGILQLLKEMAEKNKELIINILLPIDSSIRQSLSFGLLNKNIKNNNIVFQDIAPSINIKIKSLVVDRRESLIMELKHVREEKHTASIGFSIYSNSESIVLSYSSIFEVLYNQSILFTQMKEDENMKTEFINIAAHELRTPIMPILNGMEILEEKLGNKKNKFRREIDIITRNASRLQNLAEGILQVSRIESGSFSLSIQKDVDIHDLILQVIDDIEKKYMYTDKAKKVSIVFEPFSKSVMQENEKYVDNDPIVTNEIVTEEDYENNNDEKKKGYKPLYIDCDSQKISQVVFNLLDNAIKFTEQGQIAVSTAFQRQILPQNNSLYPSYPSSYPSSTSSNNVENNEVENNNGNNNDVENSNGNVENKNDILVVTIKDTGLGVSPTIKDQLFEKFSSRSTQGTGLGLYLSKKIIDAHGGKMWYEEPQNNNDYDDYRTITTTTTDSKNNNFNTNNSNNNNNNLKQKQEEKKDRQMKGSIFRFSLPVFIRR
jgi:signal transduction histidine kinase